MEDGDAVFDRVMQSVGNDGRFQKRYKIVFNFFLACFVTMAYMSHILALSIPEHWCHVPGREDKNISLEIWKNMTLPREINSQGMYVISSCQMYKNILDTENVTEPELTTCQFGYEYDKTWYEETAPSSQDWVCDKELYASNVFAVAKIGEVSAGIVFGYLGDTIGRRNVHIISLIVTCIGRFTSTFLASRYIAFIIANIVATLPAVTACQAIMMTIMEMSPSKERASIVQIQNLGWTTGLCLLPLINWAVRDWTIYIFVSTVPLLIYFALTMYLIESPRWLLSRGRISDCIQQLQIIAKVNGKKLSQENVLLLQNTASKPERVYGVGSLFSSFRLAKNTILMMIGWICFTLSYFILVLSVASTSGNPFLTFLIQSLAEYPSFLVGRVITDKIGRRFTGICGFLFTILASVTIIMVITESDMTWLKITMTFIGKFTISIAFFVIALQGLEIFPTNVRQSGNALCLMIGNIFGSIGPYIIHMGATYDARFPFAIISILGLIGIITQVLLPETLYEQLPETLQDARTFGIGQPYWKIPRKKTAVTIVGMMHINRKENECDD